MEQTLPNKKSSGEISLKELVNSIKCWLNYLLSKWLIFLLFGVLGAVIGFTYTYFKKPIYTAKSTFVLEEGDQGGGGLGQYAGLASMVGIDLGGGGGLFQGDNILELYKSRTMLQKALLSEVDINGKKVLLIDQFIDFNEYKEKWKKKPELLHIQFHQKNGEAFSRLQDSILGIAVEDINKNYLSVGKPDKKLSMIKVEVKSTDENFAKAFNEQIVKNVNDFYIQTKTKRSLQNVRVLQEKTDSVRAVMNGAIYTAAAVADATPNLNPTRQIQRAAPVQRSQFSAETNKTILGELVKNLELSKITLNKETPLIQVIDQPVFPLNKDKIGFLKGTVMGSFLFGLLLVVYLTFKYLLND